MRNPVPLYRPLLAAALAAALTTGARAQNDECSGAIAVPAGTTQNLSNASATTSVGIPGGCGMIGRDVWFSHVAACTGNLTVTTCSGATFDTVIQVLGGSCGALVDLGCNDDTCNLLSTVVVPVTSGTTCFIRVGSYTNSPGGTFALTVACTPTGGGSPGDNCTGATRVVLGTNGPFSNVGYTTSSPGWPCGAGGIDRWFAYAATFSGLHTFQTCSAATSFDTTLEVFSGICTALSSLGCNDDSCGLQSVVQANLTSGQTYLVRVGGFGGSVGNFELLVSLGNGTGSVATSTISGCGVTQLSFTGLPTLGATFTTNVGGVVGTPLIGLGFSNPNQLFCSCVFGTDWSTVFFGSTLPIQVPANPSFLNLRFYVQGADLGAPNGCGYVPYTLTDSYQVTIG